jgi:DNA-binding transcriptional regulator YhcF (GntR family)
MTAPPPSYISLDDHSATPKYLQLANSIIQAVRSGRLRKDDVLPSINELSFAYEISRDTAEKGYKHLKKIGLLGSVPGKGYFVRASEVDQPLRIFLLFNKLSAHKKIIYDAILDKLLEKATLDLYVYNNDFSLFKKLLQQRGNDYTHFVIIPHFIEGGERAPEVIDQIDKSKLILLDKLLPGVSGSFGAVYENFEKDIYSALEQALPRLTRYQTIKLIFPEHSYYPKEIVIGFKRFCDQFAFGHEVVHRIATESIQKGDVFINLMEDDLVTLIERVLALQWEIGKDVGVISYNETPLKKVILNGITTISTDFHRMGEQAANMILNQKLRHEEVPFYLTLRASL